MNEERSSKKSSSNVWRGGSRGFSISDVKNFVEVESDSGCKLVSEEYKNQKAKLDFICACGNTFTTDFDKFKNRGKRYCNDCGIKSRSLLQRKSHEDFISEVKELSNDSFEILSKYKGKKEKVKVKHSICNREYEIVAEYLIINIKNGSGCSDCGRRSGAKKRRLSTCDFRKSVKDLVGDEYSVLGDYTLSTERIKMMHEKCGRAFDVYPISFKNGVRCFHCSLERRSSLLRKTHSEFLEEAKELLGEEYEVLSEYKGNKEEIAIKHLDCNHVYRTIPSSIISGSRCPSCNSSKGERLVEDILTELKLSYTKEKRFEECRNTLPLPFDFYVENKALIEFDGDFHFTCARFISDKRKMKEKLKRTQENDVLKNIYCIENSIHLIRIPVWDAKFSGEILRSCLGWLGLIDSEDNSTVSVENYIVDEEWSQEEYIKRYKRDYWLEKRQDNDNTTR